MADAHGYATTEGANDAVAPQLCFGIVQRKGTKETPHSLFDPKEL